MLEQADCSSACPIYPVRRGRRNSRSALVVRSDGAGRSMAESPTPEEIPTLGDATERRAVSSFHFCQNDRERRTGEPRWLPRSDDQLRRGHYGTGVSAVPYLVLMTAIRLFAMILCPSADGWTPSREKAVPKVFVGANDGKGLFCAAGRPLS